MNLRRLVAVAVVLTAGAVPGTASADDAAASVNGVDISVDALEASLIENSAGDIADGEVARGMLTRLIEDEIVRQFLDVSGLDPEQSTIEEAPPPDVASVTTAYANDRISLGVVCARAIFVADGASQEAVVDALVAGEPFADVGAQYSVDPTFEQTQGSLAGGPDQPCFDLAQLRQLPREIGEALLTAPPRAVLPVADPISVLVIPGAGAVERPIAELYEGETSGRYALVAFLWSADIDINPRYGRWDPVTGMVVPLGRE